MPHPTLHFRSGTPRNAQKWPLVLCVQLCCLTSLQHGLQAVLPHEPRACSHQKGPDASPGCTDGTCMATQAAHTPQVSPQPGTVCNTNRGTRSLESITSSAVLRPSAADSSSSWRKEKVIPSTGLTTIILPILRTRLFTVPFQSEISVCQSCFKEKWLDTEDK